MTNLSPFAFALLSILSSTEENILISPYSIASALAMVLAGVTLDSPSQHQLTSVLNIGSHEDIPQLSQSILTSSQKGEAGVTLSSANGIWTRGTIEPKYVSAVEDIHGATAQRLPLTYDPLNEFVAKATNNLIPTVFEPGQIVDPLIVAVLINAIHFKGKWRIPFEEADTVDGMFTTVSGDTRPCSFMQLTRPMYVKRNVEELGDATVLQLDYGSVGEQNKPLVTKGRQERQRTKPFSVRQEEENPEFSALFFLPPDDKPESMIKMIANLTTSLSYNSTRTVKDLMPHRKERVHLSLPKFKMTYGTTSLKPSLESMGLKAPFESSTSSPQFLDLSKDPQVYLSDILHKATMEVNEEGTEAAAVTVGIIMTRSIPLPPLEVKLDRPFVMVVLHVESGTPLFIGKMDDPVFT